jgi:hypothetical protein
MNIERMSPFYLDFIEGLAENPEVKIVAFERYVPGAYHSVRTIFQVPIEQALPFLGGVAVGEGEVLGLASYVDLTYDRHIPMFDLDDGVPERFPGCISPCFVLRSGPAGGLHIIGQGLVSWADYLDLFAVLERNGVTVDPAFVCWSTRRRYGTLRMTTGGGKVLVPELAGSFSTF